MIEFDKKFEKIILLINKQERECEVTKISNLMKAEFQARLIDTDTVTIGNIQSGDTKINMSVFAKKDLLLLAWVIISIDGEERWQKWNENEKMKWLKSWAEAFPEEFENAVIKIKATCGDLL